jgi:hypothetical protein
MQQTRHGQNGASLLILVFGGPTIVTRWEDNHAD